MNNPTPTNDAANDSWWRSAAIYQVYLRSFADGDGTGDIADLRSRLQYLAYLGVDAIWINPCYPSPLADGGYDVSDYRDIHPTYGPLGEARKLIAEAHSRACGARSSAGSTARPAPSFSNAATACCARSTSPTGRPRSPTPAAPSSPRHRWAWRGSCPPTPRPCCPGADERRRDHLSPPPPRPAAPPSARACPVFLPADRTGPGPPLGARSAGCAEGSHCARGCPDVRNPQAVRSATGKTAPIPLGLTPGCPRPRRPFPCPTHPPESSGRTSGRSRTPSAPMPSPRSTCPRWPRTTTAITCRSPRPSVLPERVSLEQAAVFEPAAVALHAVRRAGIRPGETVAVLGLGPIGLLVTQLAARYGAGRIVAADRSAARRELALRLGAAETGADLADVVRGEGADVVFEAVGSEDTLRACLAATRRGGRVMFLGLAGTVRLDAFALVNNEQTIMTSVGYRDAYPELIRMVAEEGVDLAGIVTSTIALEHVVRDGFEALLRGEEQVKMLVRPRERRP